MLVFEWQKGKIQGATASSHKTKKEAKAAEAAIIQEYENGGYKIRTKIDPPIRN
jgi:hypothetical protein